MKKQIKKFKEFHGREPKNYEVLEIDDLSELFELGQAVAIEYKVKKHDDKKEYIYRHEFKKGGRVFSNGKQILIHGEKIKTTERGIIN